MSQTYFVADLKPLIQRLEVPAMVPLGAAAELLGMTKSGLFRKLEGGHPRLQLMSIVSESGTTWNGITVDSLQDEMDYQENHRPSVTKLALSQLHTLAQAEEASDYGTFMEQIGLSWRHPQHRALTGMILGKISTVLYDKYGILPSVLVVSKATQRPSDPFFQLAKDVGAYDRKKQTEQAFFEAMKAKVFASASRPAVWKWRDELGRP